MGERESWGWRGGGREGGHGVRLYIILINRSSHVSGVAEGEVLCIARRLLGLAILVCPSVPPSRGPRGKREEKNHHLSSDVPDRRSGFERTSCRILGCLALGHTWADRGSMDRRAGLNRGTCI